MVSAFNLYENVFRSSASRKKILDVTLVTVFSSKPPINTLGYENNCQVTRFQDGHQTQVITIRSYLGGLDRSTSPLLVSGSVEVSHPMILDRSSRIESHQSWRRSFQRAWGWGPIRGARLNAGAPQGIHRCSINVLDLRGCRGGPPA